MSIRSVTHIHIVTTEEQYEGVCDVRGPYFSFRDARTAAQEREIVHDLSRRFDFDPEHLPK